MFEVRTVTKLEVAERQLIEAIRLLFQRRNSIAVHSLAAAAHKVLSDIAAAQGKHTIIRNNPHLTPDPELRREYYRRIGAAYNFMKHADREPDPHATMEFRHAITPHFILDAILIYHEFAVVWPSEFRAFMVWHHCKYPALLENKAYKAFIADTVRQGIDPDNLEMFYDLIELLPSKPMR